MLNYSNLNDVEFEYLCQDIMQKKLGVRLHKFTPGQDGGIDLTDNVNTKNIVIQVKHYIRSSPSQLIASLKREVEKVVELNPQQYYVCCSKELSPQKINEIYLLFEDYMESPSNIITLNEIDEFLNDPSNIDVLEKHYKLWIESSGVLQNITNNDIFIDCESLLCNIQNDIKLFVKTTAFESSLKCLQDNNALFITGNPGVGKTITSKMLVLYFASNGYKVRFSTNVCNLSELKRSLSRNPDVKEIILVDDCFGQAYYDMKESQNTELLSLINYVNYSKNKLLILNSRITILKEAKEQKPELLKCFDNEQCKVYILNISSMNIVEKAKILYNHICTYEMDEQYFFEIKKDKRYFDIIKHPNYTPRIIEFICNKNRYNNVTKSKYYDFVMEQLNNPREIWKDEYERKLDKVDRLLLQTLYSLSDSTVEERLVRICFERRISQEKDIDTTINQYEAALTRLIDGFIRIVDEKGIRKLSMINPSVNDYLDGRLLLSQLEKQEIINNSYSIQQKKRMLSEEDFEVFSKEIIVQNKVNEYVFENERQKNAFIAYYVAKNKILNNLYKNSIQSYISDPYYLRIYKNSHIPYLQILKLLFERDICEYYNIPNFIYKRENIDNLLNSCEFDEMIEVISLVNDFFFDDKRLPFIKIVSKQLTLAIEEYCSDVDADNFDIDVESIIEENTFWDDIDHDKTYSDIEDAIVSHITGEIEDQLMLLPADIESYKDYTRDLDIYINGIDDLIDSYLDLDVYEHRGYEDSIFQKNLSYINPNEEIDNIFNRE